MTWMITGVLVAVAVIAFTIGFLTGVAFGNRQFSDSDERVRDGWSPVDGTIIGEP